jgi:hypothetical protein
MQAVVVSSLFIDAAPPLKQASHLASSSTLASRETSRFNKEDNNQSGSTARYRIELTSSILSQCCAGSRRDCLKLSSPSPKALGAVYQQLRHTQLASPALCSLRQFVFLHSSSQLICDITCLAFAFALLTSLLLGAPSEMKGCACLAWIPACPWQAMRRCAVLAAASWKRHPSPWVSLMGANRM